MDRLEEARYTINEIDKEMARLFEKRMAAVKQIAEYKQDRGVPVLDTGREKLVLERNSQYVQDDTVRSFYVRYLQNTMDVSKQYQHKIL